MKSIFFYGSLRDPDLLSLVLARPVAPGTLRPAVAADHATLRHAEEDYPVLLPRLGACADGVLFDGLNPGDLDRLQYFEEAEYSLGPIQVQNDGGVTATQCFRPTEKPAVSEAPWDFDHWYANDRDIAHEAAGELMDHFGHLPVERIDDIWSGIMARARQRVRARAAPPVDGSLGSGFGTEDVDLTRVSRRAQALFSVEENHIRHRRFDGGWTEPLRRFTFLWGDAVTVLPFDARSRRVLLIEQFRPAPAARGDRNPWLIEVIAGRIDGQDTAEETARREALEEAGVTLGRLERIAAHYPSPGVVAEQVTSFVGEADLSDCGGVHGLPGEGEDIRAFALPFDAALAAAARGAITNGPALLSLYWLAGQIDRIEADWSAGDPLVGLGQST
ncbi:MAG: NUDIX domain-containing protein [Pseudomonadota bacterium]